MYQIIIHLSGDLNLILFLLLKVLFIYLFKKKDLIQEVFYEVHFKKMYDVSRFVGNKLTNHVKINY